MTENLIHEQEYQSAPEEVTLQSVAAVIREWAETPWAQDEGLAAFCNAVLNTLPADIEQSIDSIEYSENPDYKEEFLFTIINFIDSFNDPLSTNSRINPTSPYLIHMLYRSLKFIRLNMEDKQLVKTVFGKSKQNEISFKYDFPADYGNQLAWTELVKFVMQNEEAADMLHTALLFERIQTNHPDRYATVPLFFNMENKGKPSAEVSFADFGTAEALGPKELILNERVKGTEFQEIRVMKAIPGEVEGTWQTQLQYDEETSRVVNEAIRKPLKIGKVLGFDLMGVNDPAHNRWIEASYLLREQKDEKFMARFHKLSGIKDERLILSRLDLTNDESIDAFIEDYTKQYGHRPNLDAVFVMTLKHQLKDEAEIEAVDRNAAKFSQTTIHQEFSHPSKWYPWGYKVTKKNNNSDQAPEVIGLWRDDRCQEFMLPGPATIVPSLED